MPPPVRCRLATTTRAGSASRRRFAGASYSRCPRSIVIVMVGVLVDGDWSPCSRKSLHHFAASASLHPALGGGGWSRRSSSAAVGRAEGCLARQRRISCSSSSGIGLVVCLDGGVGG